LAALGAAIAMGTWGVPEMGASRIAKFPMATERDLGLFAGEAAEATGKRESLRFGGIDGTSGLAGRV
jgi:hypothetical protein